MSGAALCALLTQDKELSGACHSGRLRDAHSSIQKGADPNWKNPNVVSLHQLVHSDCV